MTATNADQLDQPLSPLVARLRCLACGAALRLDRVSPEPAYPDLGPDGVLVCDGCEERYPVIGGTARMLDRQGRGRLLDDYPLAAGVLDSAQNGAHPPSGEAQVKQQTADSFSYEWQHFGHPRSEWQKNFENYLQPHSVEFLRGRSVLDIGAGSGRHSAQAARHGAEVVAVDLGRSIDVARRNLPPRVLTVQADAERLPFEHRSFDFVMSIGVLHHLPDPMRALRSVVPFAAPGGRTHVYLYWVPEQRVHRELLKLVTAARLLTVRLPHSLLHAACYPLSVLLYGTIVAPHRALRHRPRGRAIAALLPLKIYADYPFGVLVNDQFDRFSAPLEQRYTRRQVKTMLEQAGLEDVQVLPNSGWVGNGRAPEELPSPGPPSRVSVIVTVRNDRVGLEELLPALAAQETVPDELIVVDGGSVDDTLDAFTRFGDAPFPIRVAVEAGANIAAGRNAAVRLARNEWIACTDAGCRPEPGWLTALVSAAADADIVAGVFESDAVTPFEQVAALSHYPVTSELEEHSRLVRASHAVFGRRFMARHAGGRSMAFSRRVWEVAGGFPEKQYAGEDLAFAATAVELGFRAKLAPEAAVHWRPPGSWRETAAMFFRYCRGDVRSKGRGRHVARLTAWLGAPLAWAAGGRRTRAGLVIGTIAYVALPLRRARRAQIHPRHWWRIPVAVGLKDVSQLLGAARGVVDGIRGVPQPTPHPEPYGRSVDDFHRDRT